MARPVYTTQLVSIQGLSGSHTFLPVETVTVIRDIELYHGAVLVGGQFNLFTQVAATAFYWAPSGGAPEWYQWQGRIVIPPGFDWFIEWQPSGIPPGDDVDVTISGYALTTP